MTIGALAERSGFRPKTIRYYESIGLLPQPRRRPSGYREYDDHATQRLQFIARAKQLGLSLDEIKHVIALSDAGAVPCGHVLALLDARIDHVERTTAQLEAFAGELRKLRRVARARVKRGDVCGIIEHARIDVDLAPYQRLMPPRRAP